METESRDTSDANVSSPTPLRLLLHAVDGLVPYLTPQLLRRCFPADETDRLWIGMAVKDTCVVPSFAADADPSTSPPRGYEFTEQPSVDEWMRPFTRVTVPTFDMVADAESKHPTTTTATIVVTATDQHVMQWTANGRQALTPEQYFASAQGLDSSFTVPLFDAGGGGISVKQKRWTAAQKRTQAWSQDYQDRVGRESDKNKGILFPILVHETMDDTSLEEQLRQVDEYRATSTNPIGAVLIGWSYLPENLQKGTLQVAAERTINAPLGILTAYSLLQVVSAACYGATFIGTNLPQLWALHKKAFLFDVDAAALTETDDSEPPPTKRTKTEGPAMDRTPRNLLDADGCLDLASHTDRVAEHPWYRDKRPLMPECSCYVCRTHSRAYIYHLVCAKEMLAEILLFIHNLHQMLDLLRAIEIAAPGQRASFVSTAVALARLNDSSSK